MCKNMLILHLVSGLSFCWKLYFVSNTFMPHATHVVSELRWGRAFNKRKVEGE